MFWNFLDVGRPIFMHLSIVASYLNLKFSWFAWLLHFCFAETWHQKSFLSLYVNVYYCCEVESLVTDVSESQS